MLWRWCLGNFYLYASSCSHAGNDPGTTKGCSQLVVKLAVDISLNHGDTPCKTEFLLCAFLLLLATLHCKQKHYTCASASTILFYRVHVYSWARLPQPIRLLIESILSLFQSHSLYGVNLKLRCQHHSRIQFWQFRRCLWWIKAKPWHNEPHITNIIVKPAILFSLCTSDIVIRGLEPAHMTLLSLIDGKSRR